jgi:hypothetical protein
VKFALSAKNCLIFALSARLCFFSSAFTELEYFSLSAKICSFWWPLIAVSHKLVRCVEQLRVQPERIVQEARRLNAPETCEEGCCTLLDMAQAYQSDDGTLVINHQEHYILQLASGDRMLKEHVRRAFCRLVIEDMHRQGIEVCLQVS